MSLALHRARFTSLPLTADLRARVDAARALADRLGDILTVPDPD
jgi:hypothetical protein